MTERHPNAFAVEPTRVVFDITRPDGPAVRVRNAKSDSPWAVVEVHLPWNAAEVIVLRPNSTPQLLHGSFEGIATFIVLRETLYAPNPPVLRFSVDGQCVEHRIALVAEPPPR